MNGRSYFRGALHLSRARGVQRRQRGGNLGPRLFDVGHHEAIGPLDCRQEGREYGRRVRRQSQEVIAGRAPVTGKPVLHGAFVRARPKRHRFDRRRLASKRGTQRCRNELRE